MNGPHTQVQLIGTTQPMQPDLETSGPEAEVRYLNINPESVELFKTRTSVNVISPNSHYRFQHFFYGVCFCSSVKNNGMNQEKQMLVLSSTLLSLRPFNLYHPLKFQH